jgi:hypothetical protein
MKVQVQAKNRFARRNAYLVWVSRFDRKIHKIADSFVQVPDMSPEAVAKRESDFNAFWDDLMSRQAQSQLVEPDPEVEATKVEYVVAKVSTGEVVATFDLREDALALIKKHARQKKAKLTLVAMDGVEPFTAEELAQ